MAFQNDLYLIKMGLKEKTTGAKPRKPLNKISPKKAAADKAQKEAGRGGELDKWFEERRKGLTGICQCGCGRKSSKHEDEHYRASCCHVFPKRIFKSIALHPLNCIERNFWDGCHSVLDNTSMDRWVNMADWEDIKERFHILAPLLTDEERVTKFYQHFEKLVYQK